MLKTIGAVGLAGSLFFLFPGASEPPLGGARHVRFVNEGRAPIAELYVSAIGADAWGSDRLGPDYLAPGEGVLVDIDDRNESCRADVRFVRNDGSQLVGRDVDICRGARDGLGLR
jgi:hypothetical protein